MLCLPELKFRIAEHTHFQNMGQQKHLWITVAKNRYFLAGIFYFSVLFFTNISPKIFRKGVIAVSHHCFEVSRPKQCDTFHLAFLYSGGKTAGNRVALLNLGVKCYHTCWPFMHLEDVIQHRLFTPKAKPRLTIYFKDQKQQESFATFS